MSTLFRDATSFATVDSLKDGALVLGGMYLSDVGARLIPVVPNTGLPRVLKTAVMAGVLKFGGDRTLGAREGHDLFLGGLVLALWQGVSLATGGKMGMSAIGGGAAGGQKALNGASASAPMLPAGTVVTSQGVANNAAGVAGGYYSGTGA